MERRQDWRTQRTHQWREDKIGRHKEHNNGEKSSLEDLNNTPMQRQNFKIQRTHQWRGEDKIGRHKEHNNAEEMTRV